jgi:hypothetical protein
VLGVCSQLAELLTRIAANDRDVEYINEQALPSGAERLLVAELVARGLKGFVETTTKLRGSRSSCACRHSNTRGSIRSRGRRLDSWPPANRVRAWLRAVESGGTERTLPLSLQLAASAFLSLRLGLVIAKSTRRRERRQQTARDQKVHKLHPRAVDEQRIAFDLVDGHFE